MRNVLMLVSLLLLASGCDLAARQQARENARREQMVKELKATGEALHQKRVEPPSGELRASETPASTETKSDSAPTSDSNEATK